MGKSEWGRWKKLKVGGWEAWKVRIEAHRAERTVHSELLAKNIEIWQTDILSEGVYIPTHNSQLTTRNAKLFKKRDKRKSTQEPVKSRMDRS
jgi:hypothetical protein